MAGSLTWKPEMVQCHLLSVCKIMAFRMILDVGPTSGVQVLGTWYRPGLPGHPQAKRGRAEDRSLEQGSDAQRR